MTPHAQRIALAKACPQIASELYLTWDPDGYLWDNDKNLQIDPLEDLNVMHAAEKVLTLEQEKVYTEILEDLADKGPNTPDRRWFLFCTATAAQRLQAFLITLGLWES